MLRIVVISLCLFTFASVGRADAQTRNVLSQSWSDSATAEDGSFEVAYAEGGISVNSRRYIIATVVGLFAGSVLGRRALGTLQGTAYGAAVGLLLPAYLYYKQIGTD
ncbi:MAG: hypothetical protein WCK65_08185 [Rhodospirillaceae bacterium]